MGASGSSYVGVVTDGDDKLIGPISLSSPSVTTPT